MNRLSDPSAAEAVSCVQDAPCGDGFDYYRIGVVLTAVRSEMPGISHQYRALYDRWHIGGGGPRTIKVDVKRQKRGLLQRRRWDVIANERTRYEPTRDDEVFPYLEWAINFEVPRTLPQYLQLHASSLEIGGQGIVLPGKSGSGKSTLTTGLVARGWRYLCDEFALIHAQSLNLDPFPRAICVKKPSFTAVESMGVAIHENRHFLKGSKGYVGYVNPLDVGPHSIGHSCPIEWVIFPKYTAGEEPRLIELPRGEAAFALHEVCFNLLGCEAIGLDVIAAMIRRARCYRLVSGELAATCDLLEDLVCGRSGVTLMSA